MESRIHGDMYVRFGGRYGETYRRKAERRSVPSLQFCKYSSVADSYEHHSKFLANNQRYAKCFQLSPDDYKGWTKGIAKAGYASGMGYATDLQDIIELNGLQKYDQQVMSEMKAQGKSFDLRSSSVTTRDSPRKSWSLLSLLHRLGIRILSYRHTYSSLFILHSSFIMLHRSLLPSPVPHLCDGQTAPHSLHKCRVRCSDNSSHILPAIQQNDG